MASTHEGFPTDRSAVASYFFWNQILVFILTGIWFFGIGLVLALIHAVTLGPWLTRKQAEAARYWLDGSTLRVDTGVFFLKRKAIPLDRVTDVVMTQGPLMRWCGIWGLQIQTAGAGHGIPEATLFGLTEVEKVRDDLLAARDRAAGSAT